LHQTLFPATLEHYKDSVRFIYKDNPLPPEMHPWALHAAVDANCLAAQSGEVYWTYVDYLHSHGQEVNGENRETAKSFAALDRIARQQATLGKLDAGKLDACLVKQDETQVRASTIDGAVPEEQLWLVIDRALRAAGVEPPAAPAKPSQPAGTGK
jgi:protein-disulfide isomerase